MITFSVGVTSSIYIFLDGSQLLWAYMWIQMGSNYPLIMIYHLSVVYLKLIIRL